MYCCVCSCSLTRLLRSLQSFNQVTIWDKILWHTDKKNHQIKVTNERAEYLLIDDGTGLRYAS